MSGDYGNDEELDGLRREVTALRSRVAELQRAAARHEDTEGISLAEREELLREAERIAHLGTWTWDLGSGRVTWSDELFRILGREPGDSTPSTEAFFAAVHPEDRARAQETTEKAIRDGVLPLVDCRIVRPDGSIRHTTHSSAMLFDAGGTLRRMVGGVLDRTESIQVERLREELAHAQKMEAVGRLAGGIAHDFNNLLTVITANLELLEERVGAASELDESHRALSSAASLTRRLLAFGRKAQLSLKLVDPNELVRSTMALMHRLVGDEIRLETDLTPDLPAVRVDPLEIERALVNLVVNARDAMPGGGVVRIGSGVRRTGGEPEVELSVADQGPGIDQADLAHIFEPFYTTRRDAGGTGLGLATVLGTAEQHGGTVRVESRMGGGSIFTIVLPIADPQSAPHSVRGHSRIPKSRGRPLRLLVIDDEPMVASVTRRILETRGHKVWQASTPQEVLELWAEHGPTVDLVICDVAMAQMRGPELIALMGDRGPKPRVLFITGYSEEAVRSELQHPVLGKPFTAAALWRAIEDLVG